MRKYFNYFAFSAMLLFFTSCSFNNQFLHPTKIPGSAKKGKVIDHEKEDTLTVHIGENFQPSFTKGDSVSVEFDYGIESVVFENEVGNLLNGWIISPDSGYNNVTLLFLHGNAGNITLQYQGLLPLVKKGFKIFLFDYSGFGFSEGKATRKNTILDANAALSYLIEKSDVKYERLFIYGQSYGGHLATKIAVENEEKIDGLIIEGAFSSPDDIAAFDSGLGFFARLLTKEYFSAKEIIGEFDKPVLIIHSTEDETVPFSMGEELYNHADEPKEFMELNKCHICGPSYYPIEIAEAILRMN